MLRRKSIVRTKLKQECTVVNVYCIYVQYRKYRLLEKPSLNVVSL